MRVRLILPAMLTASVVALAGCGSAGYGDAAAKGAASQPAASSAAVPASLTFTATTLDGKAFDAASLAGHPVVLWFWAPWCGTCAGQAPTVSDVAAEYKGKVEVVGVAGMGQETEMKSFVSELEVGGITHLADKAGVVWKKFGVTEQSLYVLLDRNGKVVSKGWLDSQQFTSKVAELAAA